MYKHFIVLSASLLLLKTTYCQEIQKFTRDSLYISEVEEPYPSKVLHAEPLYIDLIRDLGARKGEREWNIGTGITDKLKYDNYNVLIEYEFAPADRIGLEVEVPFTIVAPLKGAEKDDIPSNRLESLKLAGQWTFLVSDKYNASFAIGYINELILVDLNKIDSKNVVQGNLFNPFLIAAKRFGQNLHGLIYTGPRFEKMFAGKWHNNFELNTNVHYMITGTRNFVGIEFNKQFYANDFDMTIRPQLRVAVTESVLIGIVAGISVKREEERFSSFFRVIWEPGANTH